MRPVDKGTAPRTYREYGEARNDLFERLGHYCSYCEMPIQNVPEVEHVIPRKRGGAPLDWENFLLACRYCNGVKQANNLSRRWHYWPDSDNTARAFWYQQGLPLQPHPSLTVNQQRRAQRLILLCGLNREPHSAFPPTEADTRWGFRLEVWGRAQRSLERWKRAKGTVLEQDQADSIVDQATGVGFFSIWMEVFEDEPVIRQLLIQTFTGTAQACFDGATQPVRRITGNL